MQESIFHIKLLELWTKISCQWENDSNCMQTKQLWWLRVNTSEICYTRQRWKKPNQFLHWWPLLANYLNMDQKFSLAQPYIDMLLSLFNMLLSQSWTSVMQLIRFANSWQILFLLIGQLLKDFFGILKVLFPMTYICNLLLMISSFPQQPLWCWVGIRCWW